MSKESAKKFMEDFSSKPKLIKEARKHLEKIHDKDDSLKYLCDFANSKGYTCSMEELKLFMKDFKDSLSDDELANVAGGAGGDSGDSGDSGDEDWKSILKGTGRALLIKLAMRYL